MRLPIAPLVNIRTSPGCPDKNYLELFANSQANPTVLHTAENLSISGEKSL